LHPRSNKVFDLTLNHFLVSKKQVASKRHFGYIAIKMEKQMLPPKYFLFYPGHCDALKKEIKSTIFLTKCVKCKYHFKLDFISGAY